MRLIVQCPITKALMTCTFTGIMKTKDWCPMKRDVKAIV